MGSQNLNNYLKEQRGRAFDFGVHDCFTFTNGAWCVMHGVGFADEFVGKYSGIGRNELKRLLEDTFGASDMLGCLDITLNRVEGLPRRGALVSVVAPVPYFSGVALGIAMGSTAVFLAPVGVVHLPISQITGAWTQ